jgi:hypothetical protein
VIAEKIKDWRPFHEVPFLAISNFISFFIPAFAMLFQAIMSYDNRQPVLQPLRLPVHTWNNGGLYIRIPPCEI